MKLSIISLTLLYSTHALSFSSVVGYIKVKNLDVHSQISHKALSPFKFSYISFKNIMAGNVSHDYYGHLAKISSFHCDRNRGVTNIQAVRNCQKSAHKLLKRSQNYVRRGKILKALHFLGKSLHIFQDFVSHSNLVDISAKDRKLAIAFFLGSTKKIPQSLKITGWDHKIKKGEKPGLLIGDFYPHDTYAKDLPTKNPHSTVKLKSYHGQTRFEASFNEAVNLSSAAINLYKLKINKKSWDILLLSKHFR